MENTFNIAWEKVVSSFISKQTNILCYNIEELGEISVTSEDDSIESDKSIDSIDTENILRTCAYEGANHVNDLSLETKLYNLLKIMSPHLINSHNTIYNTCLIILDPDSSETNHSGSIEDQSNEMLFEESDNID